MKLNTIIVPAWREEKGLAVILPKIFETIDDSYEVIVVDDGSDDATSQIASQFPCRLIRHEVNKGKGEAIKTGIKNAAGDNIILIDADDTYPAQAIPRMAEALKSHDMVYGSRLVGTENIPRLNRIGNAILRTLIRHIYGFMPHDYSTGFYGAKKRHLQMMDLSSKRFAIEPEICIKGCRMRLKMLDIPTEYRPRVGNTKLSAITAGFDHLKTILSLVFWQPGKRSGNG
jgi:glycosyltransferase involved in cell wall biosynthesis